MKEERKDFELFKSNVCHQLKQLGDIDFLIEALENNEVRMYYDKQWYPEAFYMLAMIDYISRINNISLCKEYDDLRKQSLSYVLYPSSTMILFLADNNDIVKEEAQKKSIPEFMKYNIVEWGIRDVY